MSIIGFIGILVFFAGLHVLWQARAIILFWAVQYVRLLRANLAAGRPAPAAATPRATHPGERNHTLRLVGGLGLIFLGQLLFLLDLAL